jgi:hypothetical protein
MNKGLNCMCESTDFDKNRCSDMSETSRICLKNILQLMPNPFQITYLGKKKGCQVGLRLARGLGTNSMLKINY